MAARPGVKIRDWDVPTGTIIVVLVNQERDLVRVCCFLINEGAGSVTRRGVEEQGAHSTSSLCWCLRLPGGRGHVRVAVIVAAFLFSV